MKITKEKIINNKSKLLAGGFVLIMVISIFTSFYFYSQLKNLSGSDENREVKMLLEKLSDHMYVPEEFPTVATVSDREKLEKRPFFDNAENGDKVLIFSQSRKAVLYRPSSDKIVDVAPIQLTTDGQSAQPAQLTVPDNNGDDSQGQDELKDQQEDNQDGSKDQQEDGEDQGESQEFSVILLNGTTKVGVTHKIETELLSEFENISIEKKTSANRDNYNETLVISNTLDGDSVLNKIGSVFNAKSSSMPEGEDEYDSDIIIIIGKDNK